MPERLRCEIGVMCSGKPEDEVLVEQEAQIAGDFWVPVCTECAAALTYIRKQALTKGNGKEGGGDGE